MADEQQDGLVVLFPENFPDWALTPEERRANLRVVEGDHYPGDDEADDSA